MHESDRGFGRQRVLWEGSVWAKTRIRGKHLWEVLKPEHFRRRGRISLEALGENELTAGWPKEDMVGGKWEEMAGAGPLGSLLALMKSKEFLFFFIISIFIFALLIHFVNCSWTCLCPPARLAAPWRQRLCVSCVLASQLIVIVLGTLNLFSKHLKKKIK